MRGRKRERIIGDGIRDLDLSTRSNRAATSPSCEGDTLSGRTSLVTLRARLQPVDLDVSRQPVIRFRNAKALAIAGVLRAADGTRTHALLHGN
jgi:hypothetical protein